MGWQYSTKHGDATTAPFDFPLRMGKDAPVESSSPSRPRLVRRSSDERPQVITLGRRPNRLKDAYARMLGAPWTALALGIVLLYLVTNALFALLYLWSGGIEQARPGSLLDAFFFSVQTLATIGYGKMAPIGIFANLLVTVEAMLGFCFYAMVTGLVFAKFSLPTARVMFSEIAVVCPYDGVPHLMLRLANERRNRIVDARVQLVLLHDEVTREGHTMRRFVDLPLVRNQVPFLQLTWTVMHRIDANSPLCAADSALLCKEGAELIVSLRGIDETLSQTIHTRYSYLPEDIRFGEVFEDIITSRADGRTEVNYHLFHATRPLPRG